MQKENKPRLIVLNGGSGSELEGPATRLRLYDRFPLIENKKLAVVVLTKLALLGGMLYFIYGIR